MRKTAVSEPATSAAAAEGPANPFVGPRALNYGEPFFGRSGELAAIRDLLIAERILVLFSPSGAGKTSLLEAGLREQLERRGFRVPPAIRVGSTPHPDLATDISNRYVLGTVLSLAPPSEEAPGDRRPLRGTLADALARYDRVSDDDPDPCFVFDQFEELFTLDPNDVDAKQAFVAELGVALQDRGRWAVFGLRQDVLGELDRYAELVPTGFESRFRLDLLTTDAACAAITQTAASVSVALDEDHVKSVVDDLSQVRVPAGGTMTYAPGRYVEPLLMQVVCYRRWGDLALGRSIVSDAGDDGPTDVDAVLSEYYDEAVERAAQEPGASEVDIRVWFDRDLITKDGVRKPTRRGPDSDQQSDLVRLLVDAHLVRRNEHAGEGWYELAHDRLVGPVRSSNAAWGATNLPLEGASRWDAEGRPRRLLLIGPDLDRARQWAAADPRHVGDVERQFLRASVWRGRIAAVVVLALIALGIGFAAIFGLWWWGREQRQTAERRAESVALAFQAINVSDPLSQPVTWVLAYQALGGERADPFLERQLVSAAHHLRHDPAYVADAGDLSADGKWLARGTTDGRVEVVDLSVPSRPREPVVGELTQVSDVEFTPDGAQLVIAAESDDNFGVGVWDRQRGGDVAWFEDAPDGAVSQLSVGEDTVVALVDGGDGRGLELRAWDLARGTLLGEPRGAVRTAVLSEEGGRVVMATDAALEGASVADLDAPVQHRAMAAGDALLAIDRLGQRAAIASAISSSLVVVDLADGTETNLERAPAGELAGAAPIVAAAFTDDALVAIDEVGRVAMWRGSGTEFESPTLFGQLPVGSIGAGAEVDFERAAQRAVVVDRGQRSLAVWELAGRPLGPLLGDRTLAPTPKGTFDGTAFVYDGRRYEMWGTAATNARDPEGRFVAAGNSEGGIVVWNQETQEETARFLFDAPVDRLVLGEDHAVVVLGDGLAGGSDLRVFDKDTFVNAGSAIPPPVGGLELFVGGFVSVGLDDAEERLVLVESDGTTTEEPVRPDVIGAAADAERIIAERGLG